MKACCRWHVHTSIAWFMIHEEKPKTTSPQHANSCARTVTWKHAMATCKVCNAQSSSTNHRHHVSKCPAYRSSTYVSVMYCMLFALHDMQSQVAGCMHACMTWLIMLHRSHQPTCTQHANLCTSTLANGTFFKSEWVFGMLSKGLPFL